MRNAVRTLMAEFALDLETALNSISSAAGMTALAMDDEPKRCAETLRSDVSIVSTVWHGPLVAIPIVPIIRLPRSS
jgi:hypothetical protein